MGNLKIYFWRFKIMKNEITYHREGDYLIPDLYMPKQPKGNIGKYGHLRLNYLERFKRHLYTELLISGTLKQHLLDVDKTCREQVNLLVSQIAKAENVNEDLKSNNQMEWIQLMNNIKNRAEEIVFNEIIYV